MLATRPRPTRIAVLASAQRRYARHRPEESLLYAIVEQHADAFFAHLGERDAVLPGFVRDEFDAYLRCGRLENGFLRAKSGGSRPVFVHPDSGHSQELPRSLGLLQSDPSMRSSPCAINRIR